MEKRGIPGSRFSGIVTLVQEDGQGLGLRCIAVADTVCLRLVLGVASRDHCGQPPRRQRGEYGHDDTNTASIDVTTVASFIIPQTLPSGGGGVVVLYRHFAIKVDHASHHCNSATRQHTP
jgi:hypothetical protein